MNIMNKIINYDKLRNGTKIKKAILKNGNYKIECISLGATLTSFQIISENKDIVLSFNSSQQYIDDPTHFGMTIGRYANRIYKGRFELDGKVFEIEKNNNGNSLHSGKACLCWKNWETSLFYHDGNPVVQFQTISKEGEDNWPGTLTVTSSYELTNKGEVILTHIANTTSSTFVNITNHSYFNLSGDCTTDILANALECHANKYLEIDNKMIPTGRLLDTEDTPFDFNTSHNIGERIRQINGYDHCLVFTDYDKSLKHQATLISEKDNLQLKVYTSLPAMQVYTSNNLKKTTINKCGNHCIPFGAICLETQYYPDSPNHNNFPSTRLDPNNQYFERTIYQLQKIHK